MGALRTVSLMVVVMVQLSSAAHAAKHVSWAAYMKKNRYKCPGPFDTLAEERRLELAGKTYRHSGYKMEVTARDEDHATKIGVVSAIKDVQDGTKQNFKEALAWFRAEGVEWIVANGDLALDELDLEEVLAMLGESGMPVLVTLGNSESRGSFARVYKDLGEKYPNLINGVWVRQVIADDVELWTVPGYHDRAFVHQGAGCAYKAKDLQTMTAKLKPGGEASVVLVSHGPPRGNGPLALDWVTAKKNVGDEGLTELLKTNKIRFGLFGHILEAGGAAVGGDFRTRVKPGEAVRALFVNAGSLSADPWQMNNGTSSRGMAVVFSLDGLRASYQVKRFKPPWE